MAKVVSVNVSEKKGLRKHAVERIELRVGTGVAGDAHAGNWHRQVSLLAEESIDEMRALGLANLTPGAFAENINTEGLELKTLPVGTVLKAGECLLAVTQIGKDCHNDGCAIRKATGRCVMPTEGIFAVVLKGGSVRAGDEIAVVTPESLAPTPKGTGTVLETERLSLREMTREDLPALRKILQDEEVMYAYEGAFSDDEVERWLEKQLGNYRTYGFGLWMVILKETGEAIGQCGLTMQEVEESRMLEIGYLFRKEFWHRGFATEAATACKAYAFEKLGAQEVCSIIRDTNIPSRNVALRNGMELTRRFLKHYRGVDMPHGVFSVRKADGGKASVSEKG